MTDHHPRYRLLRQTNDNGAPVAYVLDTCPFCGDPSPMIRVDTTYHCDDGDVLVSCCLLCALKIEDAALTGEDVTPARERDGC